MVQKILDVPYYEQQDTETCGAVCVKMAVEAIKGDTATEAVLFTETHSPEWGGSSPEKIAGTLKERGGPPASTVVVAAKTGTTAEAELVRRLIWSIRDAGVPAIALVALSQHSFTGDGHWVVVAGYEADRHPTGPDDAQCTVAALHMNNPLKAGDQVYPQHVTYQAWRRRYMKPVGSKYEDYVGSVVAVAAGTLSSA